MNHDTEVCTICLASAEDWSLHGEESFRAIFESAPDPVFVHDIETGAILEANRAACDLHGAGIDELRRLAGC